MAGKTRLSNNKKRKLRQLVDRATHAYNSGQTDACARLCKQILAIDPDNVDAVNFQGCLNFISGGIEAALPLCVRAAELAPGRIEFQLNLGRMYLARNLCKEALKHYQRAVEINSNEPAALLGACRTLLDLGRPDQVAAYVQRLQRMKIRRMDDLMMMNGIYRSLGMFDEAYAVLQRMLQRYPDQASAHFELALMVMEEGKADAAEKLVRKALTLNPSYYQALGVLAQLRRFDSTQDKDIDMIREALRQSPEGSAGRAMMHAALGRVEQQLGDIDAAFEHFRRANDIRAAHSVYDVDAELAHLEAIAVHYTEEVLARHSDATDARPVFIVGMPRCGSTLVEQILAAHPDVSARGEIALFEPVLDDVLSGESLLRMEDLAGIRPEKWADVAHTYLQRLTALGTDAKRITDKSLSNIRLIGAIYCAFPHACVVHVRRNPLDTCLSIYTSDLLGDAYDYGVRLGSLGYYYRMYERLMRHWRDVLPQGFMYEMDYESLVGDQEGETRKLLAACGLDWNGACLDFHKAEHRVDTASILQVRSRLNTSSVGRWRRYEKHLQPLIRILGTV